MGWNVMPTARNAKGIDVLIYSQDAKRTHGVQVKALSKKVPVLLGAHTDGLIGDLFVVCCNVSSQTPECFALTPSEVRALAHVGVKNDKRVVGSSPSIMTGRSSGGVAHAWERTRRPASHRDRSKLEQTHD
jgi:hypothetical protein